MTQTKHQVLSLFEQNREDLLSEARRIARQVARQRGRVSTDDIRERMLIPETVDKRFLGAIFRDKKTWKLVHYKQSKVKSSHARPIGVFAYVGAY